MDWPGPGSCRIVDFPLHFDAARSLGYLDLPSVGPVLMEQIALPLVESSSTEGFGHLRAF
jgi:hypothetical protein